MTTQDLLQKIAKDTAAMPISSIEVVARVRGYNQRHMRPSLSNHEVDEILTVALWGRTLKHEGCISTILNLYPRIGEISPITKPSYINRLVNMCHRAKTALKQWAIRA